MQRSGPTVSAPIQCIQCASTHRVPPGHPTPDVVRLQGVRFQHDYHMELVYGVDYLGMALSLLRSLVWIYLSLCISPSVSPSHLSALSPPGDARLTVPATRVWRGSLGRDIISHPSPPRLFRHGYYGFLVYRIRKRVYAHHRAASGTFPMYTRMEKREKATTASNEGQ